MVAFLLFTIFDLQFTYRDELPSDRPEMASPNI